MKKVTTILALCTLLSGSAFGQDNSSSSSMRSRNDQPPCRNNQEFAWGTGVVALAVLGVVVGLTVSQSTGSN